MRLATVIIDGTTTSAAIADGSLWRALPAPNLSALLSDHDTDVPGLSALAGAELPDAVLSLPLPHPRKVICCGHNYSDHIREMGHGVPSHPTLFAKFADTLTGPNDDIVVPPGLDLDWEAELAVVVGSRLRNASRDQAAAGIAGYTVANDISVRSWQHRTSQWLQGKAWDQTTPVGPVVVTPDEVDPSAGLAITCRINGATVQTGDTNTLVFDSAALVAYASTFTELRPGDLVLTGTPGGVGASQKPPHYLADGDVVETEISGIGVLRNTVRFRS